MDIVNLPSSALYSDLDVLLGHSALGGLDDLGELGTGPYTLWSRLSCSCRHRDHRTLDLFSVCGIATSKVGRSTVRYV